MKNLLLYLVILCFTSGSLVSQEVIFETHIVDNFFDGPGGITVADLNNDNRPDIISAGIDNNTIAWWQNNPDNPVTWTKRIIDNGFIGAIYVSTGDIDADNNIDVLGAAWNGNEIAWWHNNGEDSITWTKQIIDNLATGAHEIMSYDIDMDGDLDIIASIAGINTISYYLNDGNYPVTWTKHIVDSTFNGVRSVDLADLDSDGDIDIVGAALLSHEIAYWRNDGEEPIEWTKILVSDDFVFSHKVVIEDFNNDTYPDILGTAYNAGVKLWLNNGETGIIHWDEEYITDLNTAVIAHPIDIDNDDDIDIICSAQGLGVVELYLNDGNEPINWTEQFVDNLPGAWPLFYGDIDNDSDIDIVCGGRSANKIKWYENKGVENPYGEFAPIGAEWYYTEKFAFSGDIKYIKIESVGDSLINGKLCKVLNKSTDIECQFRPLTEFVYTEDNKVYFYDSIFSEFQVLYDYSLNEGDSWYIKLTQDLEIDSLKITIDSIAYTNINDCNLKTLYVNYNYVQNPLGYDLTSVIIEKVGDIHYLFNNFTWPLIACDANYSDGLRCYEDSVVGFYETGIADSCTYVYNWVDIQEHSKISGSIKVIPNPVSMGSQIIVNVENEVISQLKIFDISGRIVYKTGLKAGKNQIRIGNKNFKEGIYQIVLFNNGVASEKCKMLISK